MQMKPYEQYSVVDFITDDFFIDWVLQPTPKHNQFWETWTKDFPEKLDIVIEAKKTILNIQTVEALTTSSHEHFQKNWNSILQQTIAGKSIKKEKK